MSVLNQFSFVVAAGVVGLVLALLLWRWPALRPLNPLLRLGVLAAYALLVALLGLSRRYPPSPVRSLDQAEAILQGGRPTFVMLYSNY